MDSDGPGVRIGRVTAGSAAQRAGLQSGDILLQVNGRGAATANDAVQLIRGIPIGQAFTLSVWRDGNQQDVQVTMEPARESRQVGYRGDLETDERGDITDRITRLEQQLVMVTSQLQQLQQQLSQLDSAIIRQNPNAGARSSSDSLPGSVGSGATAPEQPAENVSGRQPAQDPIPPSTPPASDDLFGTERSTSK
jgi:hypothetical protein